jgi:hypothetical protein
MHLLKLTPGFSSILSANRSAKLLDHIINIRFLAHSNQNSRYSQGGPQCPQRHLAQGRSLGPIRIR